MTAVPRSQRHTRRTVLRAGLSAGAVTLLGGGGYGVSRLLTGNSERFLASWRVSTGIDGSVRHFHSAPDFEPPATKVTEHTRTAAGYLVIGPAAVGGSQEGPMIVDDAGEPVWFQHQPPGRWVTNVSVQRYRGAPVLTWWRGSVSSGYGQGEAVIVDTAYREVARLEAANGRRMDLHELQLTDRGTALFTCYPLTVEADLSPIGGPSSGSVRESVFQEVEIATGRLVMEWRSLSHIEPGESYRSPTDNFDYLHLNSIGVMPDGDLLVSGRHTWALYKLARAGGAVIWRMGGKRTQFEMGPGAQYAWQHHARALDPTTFTVFDNGDDGITRTHPTRGLVLGVDEHARRVVLTRAYRHPKSLVTTAMGSVTRLPDGHIAIGWGSEPYLTEFTADGAVVADLRIGSSTQQKSYRGFRQIWSAKPPHRPALAVRRDRSSDRATAFVSWNGATELARWRIDGGAHPAALRPLGTVPRHGFETAVNLGTSRGYVVATALDAHGRTLARSPVVAV